MHKPEVQIIADSVSPDGIRLISFQLRYWRPIHSELMTHRVFSRNAGSSRARPSATIIEQVNDDPWGPNFWGKNQAGMQAHSEVADLSKHVAQNLWRAAAHSASIHAGNLLDLGLHKQIVNRVLEPFTFIDVLVTATAFNNWYALRDHKDAQPEIRELAAAMKELQQVSTPTQLKWGEWHLPYILPADRAAVVDELASQIITDQICINDMLCKISTARCARISYRAFDGTVPPIQTDLEFYRKLLVQQPVHASPAEHQGTPDKCERVNKHLIWESPELHGNFTGWIQYRKLLKNEFIAG